MARGDTIHRQWRLIQTLQSKRFGLETDALARQLECTRRTVQRDLGVLQEVGFPISFEQRDFGKRFWKIKADFLDADAFSLSMTEMISLSLSQQMLAPLAGTPFGDGLHSALRKIRGLLPSSAIAHFSGLDKAILVKSLGGQDYSGQSDEIAMLNDAVVDQRAVGVTYASASRGRSTTGLFQPFGLVLVGPALYCVGRFGGHDDIRTLKVSRIESVKPTRGEFERPAAFSLEAYTRGSFGIFGPGRFETYRVRFSHWAATEVREQCCHRSQKIVKDDGGEVVAEFELCSTVEFKRWLLGFGPCASVLRPRKFAMEVAADLTAAASAYGLVDRRELQGARG